MPDFGIFRGFNDKLFGDKLYAGQLPINLGFIGSEDFGVDPDALAFFARVTAAGGTLSATEQLAIDTLVKQLKLDGIWSKMKAIYPMVGASAAACAQNLKSSSFTGTFTNGWTFLSDGITINADSCALDTHLIPANDLNFNDMHMSFYCRNNPTKAVDIADMGLQNGSNRFGLASYRNYFSINSAVIDISFNANVNNAIENSNSIGFWVGNVTGANSNILYKNGGKILTNTDNNNYTNYSGLIYSITLGGQNIGTYSRSPGLRNYAFSSIGDGLTDDESSDFYNAVQAFQTTLSRQV
jgi:hypothetical protein